MEPKWVPFLRAAATVFLLPLVLTILGNYYIPRIIDKSNKTEALRTARLKKSLEVGDHDKEFTTRLHRLKTMMQTFSKQNVRRKLSAAQLREVQNTFQKEYTEHYLALDETAWWWYWDLERDGQLFNLLSPDEEKTLVDLIPKYDHNAAACVGAIDPLWDYLSSSEYSLSNDSQNRISALEVKMNSDLTALHNDRVLLVKNISTLFAHSEYEPKQ